LAKSYCGRALFAGASLIVLQSLSIGAALADELPEIVVTPDRVEEPATRTGSSVTVITAAEIEKTGARGLADVLRSVPGVDVHDTGGAGSATTVALRGSNAGETLVLIDGIRIGDPSATDGSVDFGNIATTDIERIEVLRGPQSALYGSDAMGGVINIILKKGSRTPHRSIMVEGGSYGTIDTRGSMSGGDDTWTYAFSIDALHTDGFPRFGYRLNLSGVPPLPGDDPTNKGGATGRVTYRISDSVSVETGFAAYGNMIRFDNPYALLNFPPDPNAVFSHYNRSTATIFDAYTRLNVDTGPLKSQLTVFGNITNRNVWEADGCFDAFFNPFYCRMGYNGTRIGAEYQGVYNLGPYGALTFGAKTETETASTNQDPNPDDGSFVPISASQTTNSVYAQHQFTLWNRLDLSYGGRIDSVEGGQTFETWRASAAYRIDETGTRFHVSAGTGAKIPTLYQRFSQYGTPSLAPEQSFGFDVGVDQKLFNDRVTAFVTAFDNRYRDLINFADSSVCTITQQSLGGCYYNVGRAEIKGIEAGGDVILVPDQWRAKASYTFQEARDLTTGLTLLERPTNKATISLIYDGVKNLEVESRLTLVSSRYDVGLVNPVEELAPYAKLDLFANYKVNDNLTLFGRIENVTNAVYEESFDFGEPGRSYYAGIKYDW
jgi:vitamin B12 transporter